MTPIEFRLRMLEIEAIGDEEVMHCRADDLMCKLLTELGYADGVRIFERMDKWYA